MKRKIFRELVSVEEAKRVVDGLSVGKKEGEVMDIFNACGRTAFEDVYAPRDMPPFDRATMDGYAVKAEDTFKVDEENPGSLKVKGKIEPGELPTGKIGKGGAMEISTGAVIPKGCNAVVMVEYTGLEDESVLVYRPVAPGENIIAAGSDIMAGELILRKDSTITARDVAILSAVGIKEVNVSERPVVAVISTGNEVVEPGEELGHGKIYDVNSPAICSAVRENGGEPLYLGIAEDDYGKIKAKIEEGLDTADMVLASGGTSAGVGDLMHRIIEEEGEVLVHGIAVKPGKPTIIAEIDGKPVFGLPGYPVSAMMIFEIFVADLIRKMAGLQEEGRIYRAKISHKIFSSSGRREFLPVNIVGESIYPVTGNYSAAVSKLVEADGFIEIPDDTVFLEEGGYSDVKLFSTLRPADLLIIGSHCVGIDVLLELMRREHPWVVKVINVGSSGGLVAVRRGEADIAGSHLLDDETGEYNTPFISRFGLRDVLLVKGYAREQGLIVRKGNPKGIGSIEDLLREDVSIINRNPGSGTRVLLDMYLKDVADSKGLDFDDMVKEIEGYTMEAKSHTAVATGVLMDKADAGMGIKTAADRYGLDFIPLRDEEYDFVIRKDRADKEAVEQFINTLRSAEFKHELEERLPGMRITKQTGNVKEF